MTTQTPPTVPPEVRRWTPAYSDAARSWQLYTRLMDYVYPNGLKNLPPKMQSARRFLLSDRQMDYISAQAQAPDDPIPAAWRGNLRWVYPTIYVETPTPVSAPPFPNCDAPDRPHEAVAWLLASEWEMCRYVSAVPFYHRSMTCCGGSFTRSTGSLPLYSTPLHTDLRPGVPLLLDDFDEAKQTAYGEYLRRVVAQVLSLLMSKSVRIAPISPPRAVRRAEARLKETPEPWRLVKLDLQAETPTPTGERGQGSAHGYMYDVIGHIRRNRHRLADGTYRHTLEWVSPHKRGRGLYIPKTYQPTPKTETSGDGTAYLSGRRDLEWLGTGGE